MTPHADPPWLEQRQPVRLRLHVQPGGRQTEWLGVHGDALKLRLAAPPIDGRANEALLAHLAALAGVPRRDVSLLTGQSSRSKRIQIMLSPVQADVLIERLKMLVTRVG